MDESGKRCSDGGVGNALIHYSTKVECDHTPASDVYIRFARHSQAAYQGTGAVNARNADMAMYWLSTSTSVRILWEKYLEIEERSYLTSPDDDRPKW
jgi:hypothetical protein